MAQQQDTEIVLGTGKLLFIFFGIAIVCGAFFGMGYSLGRPSVPLQAQAGRLTEHPFHNIPVAHQRGKREQSQTGLPILPPHWIVTNL